ncbi:unnamed protein product, partial [Arctogadus glacialis]
KRCLCPQTKGQERHYKQYHKGNVDNTCRQTDLDTPAGHPGHSPPIGGETQISLKETAALIGHWHSSGRQAPPHSLPRPVDVGSLLFQGGTAEPGGESMLEKTSKRGI